METKLDTQGKVCTRLPGDGKVNMAIGEVSVATLPVTHVFHSLKNKEAIGLTTPVPTSQNSIPKAQMLRIGQFQGGREMGNLVILPGMKITKLPTVEPRKHRIGKATPIGTNPRVAVTPLAKRHFSGMVCGGTGMSSTERHLIQSETSREILESLSFLLGFKVTRLQVERMLSAIENGGLLPD